MLHVFGALAEFERALLHERTMAGLVAARARGAGEDAPGHSPHPSSHTPKGWPPREHRCAKSPRSSARGDPLFIGHSKVPLVQIVIHDGRIAQSHKPSDARPFKVACASVTAWVSMWMVPWSSAVTW